MARKEAAMQRRLTASRHSSDALAKIVRAPRRMRRGESNSEDDVAGNSSIATNLTVEGASAEEFQLQNLMNIEGRRRGKGGDRLGGDHKGDGAFRQTTARERGRWPQMGEA